MTETDAEASETAIETVQLTKRYGPVRAIDGIDLTVPRGSRYGFLGPNGSGKTTTVRILLGLVYPTSGAVTVLGQPVPRRVKHALRQVGAIVEAPAAYAHLSGRANLQTFDTAAGGARRTRRTRVDAALEQVGLASVGRRPVRHYSLGMRQRLGLAGALLRRPTLLVLDEPTNGLDPQGIREVRDLLRALSDDGTTLFVSSHLLAEVEQLCTHVGILDRGRLVRQDSLAELTRPIGLVEVRTPDLTRAQTLLDGRVADATGARLLVRSREPAVLNDELVRAGVRVEELHAHRPTLEDVVLAATSAGSDRTDGTSRAHVDLAEDGVLR